VSRFFLFLFFSRLSPEFCLGLHPKRNGAAECGSPKTGKLAGRNGCIGCSTVLLVSVPAAPAGIGHAAAFPAFARLWWPLGQFLPFIPKNTTLENTALARCTSIAGQIADSGAGPACGRRVKTSCDWTAISTLATHYLPGEPAIGPAPCRRHHFCSASLARDVWSGSRGQSAWVWGLGWGVGLGPTGRYRKGPQRSTAVAVRMAGPKWHHRRLRSPVSGPSWPGNLLPIGRSAITFDENRPKTGQAGDAPRSADSHSLGLGVVTDSGAWSCGFLSLTEAFPTATSQS